MIEKRTREIFEAIEKEVKKFLKEETLPAGAVLTGGGAKMPGIVEFAKVSLKVPARVGRPREVDGEGGEVFDPSFSTTIGALLLAHDHATLHPSGLMSSLEGEGIIRKAREWLREFLP
jgi:cell division protein FtsA